MADKKGAKTGQKKEKQVKLSEDARMKQMLNNKIKEMETEFDVNDHLVIDLGNAFTKIGYSGKDLPNLTIPSIYARNKSSDKKNEVGGFDQKIDIFGYEATDPKYQDKENYDYFNLTCGDHKKETSKEYLEFLKDALENKLNISPSDYDVIVNISPIKNEKNIKIYGHLFIEELGFKAMAMINSSSLSLYATGRTCGLVVQCGEVRTYTAPVYEGFPLYHALNKSKIGGANLTEIFKQGIMDLPEKEKINIKPEDIRTLREVKESTCSVPYEKPYKYYLDVNNPDIISEAKRKYKLPDETETIVDIPRTSRILASELLFTPNVWKNQGKEAGLIDLINDSIKKTEIMDKKFKEIFLENIVLSGGTTMIEGFSNRVYQDLLKGTSDNNSEKEIIPKVIAENNRSIGKWIGMSMIASMTAFDKLFIKKSDYLDLGEERFSEVAQIF